MPGKEIIFSLILTFLNSVKAYIFPYETNVTKIYKGIFEIISKKWVSDYLHITKKCTDLKHEKDGLP